MDKAWIGLFGAFLGGILAAAGSILTTMVQNSNQRKTAEAQQKAAEDQQKEDRRWQMLQERHSERKAAYAEFLQALRAAQGDLDGIDAVEGVSGLLGLGSTIHDKLAVVRLVGGVSVHELATNAVVAVTEYHSVVGLRLSRMTGSEMKVYPQRLERAKEQAATTIKDVERAFRADLINPDIGIEPDWAELCPCGQNDGLGAFGRVGVH